VVPSVSKASSPLNLDNEETSGNGIPTTKPCIPENLKPKLRKCLEIERNIREQQNEGRKKDINA
jgi:hypothetical protein